ncbi:MAG TPA: Uma2 family endonuclease [Thermoanaerobaculia bacterium]|nr:Uma2 family endonuclease [Thermoanaerobaculia bacterium]
MNAIPLEQEVEYPISDGQPMAESPLHMKVMFDLIEGLTRRYAEVPDVWVGGNLFLCYERGNPAACLAPDVLVAKGVANWMRPNYLLWEEKVPPCLVVEVTSRKTRREDQVKKKNVYEGIGVEEYVLFDPSGEYLRPRLQGYRLQDGRYQAVRLEEDGSLLSQATGLRLRPEGQRLRLVDAVTGEPVLWPEEVEAARRAAEERVRALEEELSRLRKAAASQG